MKTNLADYCVYTIMQPEELKRLAKQKSVHSLTQNKPWTTAYTLFQKAQKAGEHFAVVFADATDCSRLMYMANVLSMQCADKKTTITFENLRPIKGNRTTQELVLRSTGEHIAPGFIRPYAICHAPEFL